MVKRNSESSIIREERKVVAQTGVREDLQLLLRAATPFRCFRSQPAIEFLLGEVQQGCKGALPLPQIAILVSSPRQAATLERSLGILNFAETTDQVEKKQGRQRVQSIRADCCLLLHH